MRKRYRSYPAEWFVDDRSEDKRLDPYGAAEGSAEAVANTLLCLIHQAIYLLKRQLASQEQVFLEQGGFTERLYQQRRRRREGG